MVLVLELVGIGVLGACLSVLLCIIAEGTPRKVLKVIDLEANTREPQINQCTKRQSEANNGSMAMTENLRENSNSAVKKVRPNGQKELKHRSDISVRNLYVNNKMTAVNADDDSAENPFSIENLRGSTDTATKFCKYCGTYEISNEKKNLQDKSIILSKKSENRMKSTLVTVKNYEESKKLYNDEWRKVRTKNRRFILPKTLIIDSKVKNNTSGIHGVLEDDFYKRIVCRHCYLEALRIKNNKVEKNSIDL